MAIMKTLFSLLALATTVLSKDNVPLDTWTLYNSSITCNTSCEYKFFIEKHNSGETYPCNLHTEGPPNPQAILIDRPCHADPHLALTINWGMDRSIIFCIADLDEKAIAYYSLESYEVRNGTIVPNKTERAWGLGQVPTLSTGSTPLPEIWL
ncbi:uncharacterized protein GGS22DRAFT_189468 [Annulohypoxylon maeteangense]|uniref:uncharacterized protein n=1 Tax=Annulohypoxylon maeteangense TaxID=1927788 RepID=UPI0020088D72|nr:uncharacterized protein GGS22DRAFT_189468 [Annulohypoxylon maeteangense]KAI0884339.1 hypothetical protein GGS22DRAFT_189468 [Annulohypoxylon maeteangense]